MSSEVANQARFQVGSVIGQPIDVLTWEVAIQRVGYWARDRESRVVCICNSHSLVTARQDEEFGAVIRGADMATADGYPVAYLLRAQGFRNQERINGPDLMLKCCDQLAAEGESIYLYGSTTETLERLRKVLTERFPTLQIAGMHSPPFRDLTHEEDESVVAEINASGAAVVWVSLGCPKQERWMSAHRGRINAVMIGVGAAFDYHAGVIQRAPLWMQRNGLEWFYRFCQEPRRLWRRYLVTNGMFLWYAAVDRFSVRAIS